MHGLEANRVAIGIGDALFAHDAAVVTIGSIDLHARFGGEDLHDATAVGVCEACYRFVEVAAMVQAVAMVVATGDFELGMVGIDVLTDGLGGAEVERRSCGL